MLQSKPDRRAVIKRGAILAAGALATPALLRYALAQADAVPVRRPAHELKPTDKVVVSFKRAIQEMRRKPDYHPAHWEQMRRYHAQLCGPDDGRRSTAEIHGTWWFLPWHRAYLATVEHLMRKLADDPSFAIPYWDWHRHPKVPPIFLGDPAGNTLAHAARDVGGRAEIKAAWEALRPADEPKAVDSDDFAAFAGEAPKTVDGAPVFGSAGAIDPIHGRGHIYIGGRTGDMRNFHDAGRDPIFYAHHANVDRMWEVWRNSARPGLPRPDPSDATWGQHQFAFQDESGGALIVKSADVVDTTAVRFAHYSVVGAPELVVGYRYARDRLDQPLPERIASTRPVSTIRLAQSAEPNSPTKAPARTKSKGAPSPAENRPLVGRPAPLAPTASGGPPTPPLASGAQVSLEIGGIKMPSETVFITTALKLADGRRVPVGTDPVIPFRPPGETAKFDKSIDITDVLRREHLGVDDIQVEVTARTDRGTTALEVDSLSLRVR